MIATVTSAAGTDTPASSGVVTTTVSDESEAVRQLAKMDPNASTPTLEFRGTTRFSGPLRFSKRPGGADGTLAPLRIVGESSENNGRGTVLQFPGVPGYAIDSGGDGTPLWLDRIRLEGARVPGAHGVRFGPSCKATNVTFGSFDDNLTLGRDHCDILDCRIDGALHAGIAFPEHVSGDGDVTIRNCRLENNAYAAIYIHPNGRMVKVACDNIHITNTDAVIRTDIVPGQRGGFLTVCTFRDCSVEQVGRYLLLDAAYITDFSGLYMGYPRAMPAGHESDPRIDIRWAEGITLRGGAPKGTTRFDFTRNVRWEDMPVWGGIGTDPWLKVRYGSPVRGGCGMADVAFCACGEKIAKGERVRFTAKNDEFYARRADKPQYFDAKGMPTREWRVDGIALQDGDYDSPWIGVLTKGWHAGLGDQD
jgi:hypothetical protein